jgi:hypothetical protein
VITHTRPEMAAELNLCRRLRSKILNDPCAFCQFREVLWGKATCKGHTGRTWWQCRDGKTEPTFTLDRDTIEGETTT